MTSRRASRPPQAPRPRTGPRASANHGSRTAPTPPLPLRPGGEFVYQVFPDRWRIGAPAAPPREPAWTWHGRPTHHSLDPLVLTAHPACQHTFMGGNLEGVRQSIPHLQSLGVTALYMTPIFEARSTHRYDAVDYTRIDPTLGDRGDFERLSSSLREAGIRLVLDGVLNHTSADHPLHADVLSRRRHYLMKNHDEAMSWMDRGTLPKLDTSNPRTVKMLLDVLSSWPEADAWRLDAAHLLPQEFLRRVRGHVAPRPIIVEDWMWSRHYFTQKLADGVTNYLFRETMRNYFREDCSPETLLERIRAWTDCYPARGLGMSWNYLDNHDTDRFSSQVGRDRLRRALVFLFALPGTPMIYQGLEVGMTGKSEAESRAPMEWNVATWDRELLAHVRALAAFRAAHPVLRTGRYEPLAADIRSRTVVFARILPRAQATIAVNDGYHAFRGKGFSLAPGRWMIRVEEKGKKPLTLAG